MRITKKCPWCHGAYLENVIPWVVANGSKSEIDFFSAFSEKVDAAVNKEKKQSQTSQLSAGSYFVRIQLKISY